MKEFIVSTSDRIGAVRDVFKAIASTGINIKAVSTDVCGKEGQIRVITNDHDKTRETLKKGGFKFAENEVVTMRLEDKPGQLLKCIEDFAKDNINIKSAYIVGKERNGSMMGFVVDDVAKAKKLCYPGLTQP